MTGTPATILPGSWADWARQVAELPTIGESGQIIKQASAFAREAGITLESAVAKHLWLGSLAMLNYTSVHWQTGIWHPSSMVIATVERDGVAIDSITNGFIHVVRKLGLDPIQDTVKEGPSGLIARLEQSRPDRRKDRLGSEIGTDIASLANVDTSDIDPAELENLGNVRGLIYPSGRSFLSYLYDTPFFNALDELIQHGSFHVRGKVDSHVLRNLNLAAYLPFYQGALANMLANDSVQRNFNILLRQMILFWPMESSEGTGRRNVGKALDVVGESARRGLETLEALAPPHIEAKNFSFADTPLISLGVGVRYAGLNRDERLTRIALGIAFWRITSGQTDFTLLDSDYAMADLILYAHETGSRLAEICSSKGRVGVDLLRFLVSASADYDTDAAYIGLSQATNEKEKLGLLELASHMDILTGDNRLHESYRFVNGDVIRSHLKRWKIG